MDSKYDILAKIKFLSEEEGGRKLPLPKDKFGCLANINNEYWDCRLYLNNNFDYKEESIIPIKFLNYQILYPSLFLGQKFTLWDGKTIAYGRIEKLTKNSSNCVI